MTYFIIPLFNNKEENKIILDTLSHNMSKVDTDDFILGFFPINDLISFKKTMVNNLLKLGLEINFNETSKSFIKVTNDFLTSIVNAKNVDRKAKIALILTYFALFGLTIKPIADRNELMNRVLLDSQCLIPDNTLTWLNELILINGFYHVETNYPFNEFEICEYFSINHFMSLFKFFIKCL